MSSSNTSRRVSRRRSPKQAFTVLQIHERDDFEQIRPIGEIDLYTAPVLREALADAEQRKVRNVLVDMSDVQFLALVGVRVLRTAAEQSAAENRRLVLAAPTQPVQRVLSLTDVTAELEIYVTLPSALSALART